MRTILIAAALCFGITAAQAADNGIYLGIGASKNSFDIPNSVDDEDTGFKAIAGVRLLDSFGVELNYADHGEARAEFPCAPSSTICGATRFEARTSTVSAVAFLPFPVIDLFAKAGLSYSDSALRSGSLHIGDDGTHFAWGAGVQAHFLSFAARAEYERFEIYGDRKLEVLSASVIYTFL